MRNVENKLLARIIDRVDKLDSECKLFALFDKINNTDGDDYEASNMLVRANLN